MLYFGIFRLEHLKTIVIFEFNAPRIFLKAKFCAEIKILKFETKNALFRCFYPPNW